MSTTKFAQPDNRGPGGDPNVPRDRWGRPLIAQEDGSKPIAYTRATTFIGALSDTTFLTAWKLRIAGQGLAQRDDLIAQIKQADPEDKKTLNKVMNEALDQGGQYDKANIGTMIHNATEAHDRGEPIPEMGEYRADLDAYINAMHPFKIIDVETFRVNDELRIGGTADRVVEHDGQRYIADIKTGGLYDVGGFAQQLSIYSRSIPYDYATGKRAPDPVPVSTTHGLLIHMPAGEGKVELFWLNLVEGWKAVQLSAQVREYRQFISRKATRDQVIIPASF